MNELCTLVIKSIGLSCAEWILCNVIMDHLENIGLLNYVDLPNVDTFNMYMKYISITMRDEFSKGVIFA